MSTQVNIVDKIQEAIRHRYSPDSIIKNAFDNNIIRQLGEHKLKLLKRFNTYLNPNLLILRPELTETFRISYAGDKSKTIYFNEIVRNYCTDVLGYDPTTPEGKEKVHALLKQVASKNLKIAVVGYGGAMINFLWNLYLLSYISSYNEPIFKNITIFEKDNISITNILRISKPVLLESFLQVHTDEGSLPKLRLLKEEYQLAESITAIKQFLTDPEEVEKLKNDGYIFIGAPNFEARVLLQDTEFLFMGHANNELEIFYTPIVNTELTFESYGSIDVPVLLANLAVGTIKLMEILSTIPKTTKKLNIEKGSSLFKIDYGQVYGLTPTEVPTETPTEAPTETPTV